MQYIQQNIQDTPYKLLFCCASVTGWKTDIRKTGFSRHYGVTIKGPLWAPQYDNDGFHPRGFRQVLHWAAMIPRHVSLLVFPTAYLYTLAFFPQSIEKCFPFRRNTTELFQILVLFWTWWKLMDSFFFVGDENKALGKIYRKMVS